MKLRGKFEYSLFSSQPLFPPALLTNTTAPGIGQYTAYAFARQGIRSFALLDRNPLTATVAQLKKDYPDVAIKTIEADVTSEPAVNDSIAQTVKEFGRIDHAVNNAGIGGAIKPTADIDLADFERVLAVNAKGVWLCQRAQIRQMLTQSRLSDSPRAFRGTIVNAASMYGVVAPSSATPATAYTASKHAVMGLTKADAVVYAPQGIRINAICPGYVATPLLGDTTAATEIMKGELAKVPLGRLALMEEIGDCIAFLSSEASSFMVGAGLVVDGGFTPQ
jgi:NAD(P)-dependent dehydrogenase (short-subunit alcohol dehydrogenase family)